MRTITIAITTYNRYQFTIDSFAQVIDDERVKEIVISDDASTDGSFEKLKEHFKDNPKVNVRQNSVNFDCYRNKQVAMINESEWCCLWDSDNVFDKSYLDAIYADNWDEHTFYLPEFARPYFDARQWSGHIITKENVAQYADTNLMTNLNAMNFFINSEEYLRVWDGSVDPISSDSIYFSYCWLKAGNKIYITPNLQYDHTIHKNNEGHFTQNQHRTVDFHNQLMEKIKQLR